MYAIDNSMCYGKVVLLHFVVFYSEANVCLKCLATKQQLFCLIITLFRWPLIIENKHLSRDLQLPSVTRNCQIYSTQLNTLITCFFFKFKEFLNFIIVKRNFCWTNNAVLFLQTFDPKRHASFISLLTRNCRVHCISIN